MERGGQIREKRNQGAFLGVRRGLSEKEEAEDTNLSVVSILIILKATEWGRITWRNKQKKEKRNHKSKP